jgi:RNA polymerase-binding transcription factor
MEEYVVASRKKAVQMGNSRRTEQVEKLLQVKEQLLAEVQRLRDALKTEVDPDADEGDPDLVEREKALALVSTMEYRLESIEYALRQAQEGSYGICERCGEPIDPARLEALPEATLCIKCKAIVERQSRLKPTANNQT